jgi:two-component system, OmpR family, sensor kinase
MVGKNSTNHPRLPRFNLWRNSIHLYLLAPPLMLMAAMTAFSLVVLHIADLPMEGRPISIYEMTRLLRGEPLAGSPGTLTTRRQPNPPRTGKSDLERLLASQLAGKLGRPETDIRLTIADHSEVRFGQVAEHIRIYSVDGAANPVVFGSFSVAQREGASWRVVERPTPGTAWRINLWTSLAFGLLLTIPLTLWFSGLLKLCQPRRSR